MHLVFYLLAAVLVALNVADWRLTRAIILSGRGHEANPVMAWLIACVGLDRALIGKVVGVAIIALWLAASVGPAQPLAAALILLGLVGLYTWVVLNNLRVLHP